MPDLPPTFQDLVNQEAEKRGITPLEGREAVWVEYAPVGKDGTIWWAFKTTDRDSLTIQEGGSVAARVIEFRESAWTVVGPDWRPGA